MTENERRTFLVECYVPGIDLAAVEEDAARARMVAAQLHGTGRDIEYVRAIHVPGDEVVFHVFEAGDERLVREVGVRSELPFERVVASVSVGGVAVRESEEARHEVYTETEEP